MKRLFNVRVHDEFLQKPVSVLKKYIYEKLSCYYEKLPRITINLSGNYLFFYIR